MGMNRNRLVELLDEGALCPKQLANDLLGYLSEDECADFASNNDIQLFDENEEENEDEND